MKPQAEAMFKLKAKLFITILNQSTVVLVIIRWWVFPEMAAEALPSCIPLAM